MGQEAENSDWLERRGITNPQILEAMRSVDRDPFYKASADHNAHSSRLDRTTITPPEVIAKMIDAMQLGANPTVLQIGTGTGYIPALLAKMANAVFTTETDAASAKEAASRLQEMGIKNVQVLYGSTLNEYATNGPYEAILVSAGMARIPDRLAKRLHINGVLVAPVGSGRKQQLVRLTRKGEDEFETEILGDLRVMPLLGDILVEMGVVDRQDVEMAALEADVGGKMLGEALLEGKDVKESDIYEALARQRDMKLISARDVLSQLDRATVGTIPRAFLSHNRLLPINRREDTLRIATTDPSVDGEELAVALGIQVLELFLITPTDYQLVWDALENKARRDSVSLEQSSEVIDEDFVPLSAETISGFERILHQAIEYRASDIHFERNGDLVSVRYRVDGELRPSSVSMDPERLAEIAHLVKVSARMERGGARRPQRGHFQRRFANRVFDIRALVIPAMFGEHITLRILPQDQDVLSLAELGFPEESTAGVRTILERGRGVVLVVGASGSGRSTTLHSIVRELASSGRKKIASVEDPVTYALSGVQQVRVDPSVDFYVENAVEACLASDLDVLLIGELNSRRLMELAIEASRGGLLVLSSFLGRDVFDAFDRFEELGVSRRSAVRELEAVISQTLAPKICVSCREPSSKRVPAFESAETFEGLGCSQCSEKGTRGRIAVSEFLKLSGDTKSAAVLGGRAEIIAAAGNYVSYKDSAFALVERGVVTARDLEGFEF